MNKSLIRVGTVSDRDVKNYSVRVIFTDQDDLVTDWLPVIVTQAHKTKSFMLPDIDDTVVCVFLGSGIEAGFCVGAIYSDDVPATNGDQFGVWFPDGSKVVFNRADGTLDIDAKGSVTVKAPNISLQGNVSINGNLSVTGTITRGGISI